MYVTQKRLLTAKSGSGLSPVTDGLVLWIDGRDQFAFESYRDDDGVLHSGVKDDSMYNRADGLEIECTFYQANIFNTGDGYLSISDGYGNYSTILSQTSRLSNTVVKTTEMCGYLIPSGDSSKTTRYYFGRVSTTANTCMVTISSASPMLESAVKCITTPINEYGNSVSYLNGEVVSDTYGYGSNEYKCLTRIGGTSGSCLHDTFYLGSLRMYNRQLTAEEVMQNYEYERSLGRA